MSLKIQFPLDPQSACARRLKRKTETGFPPPSLAYASSPEAETLKETLRAYYRGELEGQSFLIAGHRGAGKTTLVWNALLDVELEARAGSVATERRDGPCRFLPIKLDGPSLFEVFESKGCSRLSGAAGTQRQSEEESENRQTKSAKENESKSNGEALPHEKVDQLHAMLEHVMQRGYDELAKEFSTSIRERVMAKPNGQFQSRSDGAEMAAHLELLFDTGPLPDVLRDYWWRMGAIERGFLFSSEDSEKPPPGDQGARELTALATAAIAYQKIIGKLTAQQTTDSNIDQTRSLANNFSQDAQPDSKAGTNSSVKVLQLSGGSGSMTGALRLLTAPVLALVAGGLGGAVYLTKGAELSTAIAASAITVGGALATLLGVEMVTTRIDKRSRRDSSVLEIDTHPSTLVRDLPRLINRIKEAGLLPVFVIDELDKVDPLIKLMQETVKHLKNIVTEEAVFLFMVDRYYFDHLRRIDRKLAYPPELTYFNQRLFVAYRPRDLFDHFSNIFPADKDHSRSDADARWVLIYAAMQYSRMHVFHLRRYLRRIVHQDQTLKVTAAEILRSGRKDYRVQVLMQLAVLKALQNDEVRVRLSDDSYFVQQVYDAAYYPARVWRDGDNVIDISFESFKGYMEQRTRQADSSNQKNGDHRNDVETSTNRNGVDTEPELELTSSDLKFLQKIMLEVVGYLADPASLMRRTRALLPDEEPSAVLLTEGVRERVRVDDEAFRYQQMLVVPASVYDVVFPAHAGPNTNRFLIRPEKEGLEPTVRKAGRAELKELVDGGSEEIAHSFGGNGEVPSDTASAKSKKDEKTVEDRTSAQTDERLEGERIHLLKRLGLLLRKKEALVWVRNEAGGEMRGKISEAVSGKLIDKEGGLETKRATAHALLQIGAIENFFRNLTHQAAEYKDEEAISPGSLIELHLMPSSAQWEPVQEAAMILKEDSRLENFFKIFDRKQNLKDEDEKKRNEFVQHLEDVEAYVQQFKERSPALSRALLLGAVLGQLLPGGGEKSAQRYQGLQILKDCLNFDTLNSTTQLTEAIDGVLIPDGLLYQYVAQYLEENPIDFGAEEPGSEAFFERLDSVEEEVSKAQADIIAQAHEKLWSAWRLRLTEFLTRDATQFDAEEFDLIAVADRRHPATALKLDLDAVTLHGWSEVLLRAFGVIGANETDEEFPMWIAVPAAFRLNLAWLLLPMQRLAAANRHVLPLIRFMYFVVRLVGRQGWNRKNISDLEEFKEFVEQHKVLVKSKAKDDSERDQIMIITEESPHLTEGWTNAGRCGVISLSAQVLPIFMLLRRRLFGVSERLAILRFIRKRLFARRTAADQFRPDPTQYFDVYDVQSVSDVKTLQRSLGEGWSVTHGNRRHALILGDHTEAGLSPEEFVRGADSIDSAITAIRQRLDDEPESKA